MKIHLKFENTDIYAILFVFVGSVYPVIIDESFDTFEMNQIEINPSIAGALLESGSPASFSEWVARPIASLNQIQIRKNVVLNELISGNLFSSHKLVIQKPYYFVFSGLSPPTLVLT